MSLISRKKTPPPHRRALGIVSLAVRALVAQRVLRKAHKGYKWTRRLPLLISGGAIAALVGRKVLQQQSGADAGFTPPTPAPAASSGSPAADTVPASVPSTPTPTGSPTATSPAPTAAAPDDEDATPER